MSKQIFVSHSKYDEEMVASFDRVFARTGVKSVCMEFEKMNSPEWKAIRDAVSFSTATFVLLGQNVNRSIYTQNWVAFEVGLACAMDKKVWVFEQTSSNVNFPIPYVTDYMLYNSLEKTDAFDYIRRIIEGYGERTYFNKVGVPIVEIPKGQAIKCSECDSRFNFHYVLDSSSKQRFAKFVLTCPLCRQNISL